MSKRISFCLIQKNESKNLPSCLNSIRDVADEIVIVDTGSTDNSIEIAKNYTDKIFQGNFDDADGDMDYSKARNESLKHATGDYIFQIDCDEYLPQCCIDTLKKIKEKDTLALYLVLVASQVDGLPEPAFSSNFRLFPRDPEIQYHFIIHENINNPGKDAEKGTPGKYEELRVEGLLIHHTGYMRKEKARKGTDNRNIRLLEKQIKLTPDHLYFLYHLGQQYYGCGEYEKSIKNYERFCEVLKEHPTDIHNIYLPTVQEGLLVACMRAEKLERMEEFCKMDSINPGFWYNLGLWYEHEKNDNKALELYDQAIDNSRNANKLVNCDLAKVTWMPYLTKSGIYIRHKKYQRAIDCLKLALTESPKNITVINMLARTYALDMRGKQAEKFAELSCKYENTYNNRLHLADVWINFGQEDKGLAIYFKEASPEHLLMLRDAMKEGKADVAKKIDEHLTARDYIKFVDKNPRADCLTIIIPTLLKADKNMFITSLKMLQRSKAVRKIIVINNNKEIHSEKYFDRKEFIEGATIHFSDGENRYVNGAWNYGMTLCETDYFLLLNDDCLVRPEILDECVSVLDARKDAGIIIYTTETEIPQTYFMKEVKSEQIITAHVPLNFCVGGWFMFGRSESWIPIPEELKIFCGDNFIWETTILKKHQEILKVLSNYVSHFTSTTVEAENLYAKGVLDKELELYAGIKKKLRY